MTTVSNLGEVNNTGDEYALFLKKWSGEILTTFEESNVMKDLHTVRTITSGKSAQFPVIGTAITKYHTPGDSVIETADYASNILHGERLIWVDKMLTSSVFIAKVEELINHYDVRGIYGTELGRALAKKFDQQMLLLSVIGAYTDSDGEGSGMFDTGKGGTVVRTAAGGVAPADIAQGIRVAMAELDQKDVPQEDRAVIVSPDTYYRLVEHKEFVSQDYTSNNGGLDSGKIFNIYGGRIVMSNHIPADIDHTDATNKHGSAAAGDGNSYAIDLTSSNTGLTSNAGVKAVVLQKSGLGTVKLMDLAMESEYQVERQGSLFVSKYAMGHGVIRPECCAVVQTSDGSEVDVTAS